METSASGRRRRSCASSTPPAERQLRPREPIVSWVFILPLISFLWLASRMPHPALRLKSPGVLSFRDCMSTSVVNSCHDQTEQRRRRAGGSPKVRRRSWMRPRLDWLLVFVPIAIALRFVRLWRTRRRSSWFRASPSSRSPAGWDARRSTWRSIWARRRRTAERHLGNAARADYRASSPLSKGLTGVVQGFHHGSISATCCSSSALVPAGGAKFRSRSSTGSRRRLQRRRSRWRPSRSSSRPSSTTRPKPCPSSRAAGRRRGAGLSAAIAVVLFLTYAATLVFSLVTHRELFGGSDAHRARGGPRAVLMEARRASTRRGPSASPSGVLLEASHSSRSSPSSWSGPSRARAARSA